MDDNLTPLPSADEVTVSRHESVTVVKSFSALPPSQLKRLKEKKEEELPRWYAMRATYRAEQSMQQKLQEKGFECFVPLVIREKVVAGKRKRYMAPAVNSLIFVHGVKQHIQDFKVKEPRLQYQCAKTLDGHNLPIIVPDHQMQAFIRVYTEGDCEIAEIGETFTPGQQVRVTYGPFEGMTGTFQRVRGHRDRRFVIAIRGVALISTALVDPSMLQPL